MCILDKLTLNTEFNSSLTSIRSGQEQDLIETKAVDVGVEGEKVGGRGGITLLGDVQKVGSEGGEADRR